jgi:hypothetical protein
LLLTTKLLLKKPDSSAAPALTAFKRVVLSMGKDKPDFTLRFAEKNICYGGTGILDLSCLWSFL